MKRLILRIAALGTVVVLGLFAIAQAQRGPEPSLPEDGKSPTAKAPSGKSPTPELIKETATMGARPLSGDRSGISDGNPLRDPVHQVSAADRYLTSEVLLGQRPAPSATELQPLPEQQPIETSPTTVVEQGSVYGGMPADPTLARAMPGESAAAGPAMIREALGAAPRQFPDSADRYSQLPKPPPDTQRAATLPPLESQPQGHPLREPAALRSDPFPSPAAIPLPDAVASDVFTPPPGALVSGASAAPAEGTGQPGGKQLEGPQSPQLTIQKFAPQQIQVGKPATFRVTVQNTGMVAASGVEVRDRIPKGTRLLTTTPRATPGMRGELVWTLGTINPGEQSQIEIELMPIAEGELGSVATVTFQADASARAFATKPELVLKTSAPSQVLIGEQLTLTVEVSNPGSGTATGVVLQEHIPAGLQHAAGADLEYEIGDLPPGESRTLQLTLTASKAGPVTNVLTAQADANLKTEDRLHLEVIAPLLNVAMAGPQRRYLEREAVYQLSVTNPGTAAAEEVELVAYLPSGLKFVSANHSGHYEEVNRAVHWRLAELPINETGTVELVTMPVEAGQQKIRLHGTAKKGLSVEDDREVTVEGIAAIKYEVVDVTDPIEVGGETSYEIRVVNQGSKAATNVRLAVLLPAELQAVAAEGPTRHLFDGSRVLFDGLSRLAPKADTTYRVRVKGLQPGDLRVKVQLITDDMRTPVTKEESTRVYRDE